jgi:hypothetical protein
MSLFQFLPDAFQSELVSVVQKQIADIQAGQTGISNLAEGIFGVEWNGADADAFYQNEIMLRFMPEVAQLIAAIGGFMGGLNFATDMFDSVDSEVMNTANEIGDLFDSVF